MNPRNPRRSASGIERFREDQIEAGDYSALRHGNVRKIREAQRA